MPSHSGGIGPGAFSANVIRLAGIVLLAMGMSGCQGDEAVSPKEAIIPISPSVSLPGSQSFFVPVNPTTELTIPADPIYVSTGVVVPNDITARLTVTGAVTANFNPSCGVGPQLTLYYPGFVDGTAQWLTVGWFLGPIGGGQLPNGFTAINNNPVNGGVAYYSPVFNGTGEIQLRRQPWVSTCSPGPSPAYLLSGGQTVQVDFLTMDVAASDTALVPNQSVTFTTTPLNFLPSSPDVFWAYYPDGQQVGISIDACAGQSTCTYTPTTAGRMMALSLEPVVGFSARIRIIRCPTDDPLLDEAGLADELERLMQKSLADPAKKEFKGIVWQNRTTGAIRFEELVPVRSDPLGCWVETSVPPSTSTEKIIATYHAHPHFHGEDITCTSPQTGQILSGTVDYQSWGGGSIFDWQAALDLSNREGSLVPTYVMDFNRIHKLNPVNPAKSSWASNAQHWPRCTTPMGG